MQRFYKQAASTPVDDGFEIRLDDRPVRTPGRRKLTVPAPALATAIAREWAEQGEKIDPDSMPLTRIAATALDRAGPDRQAVTAAIAAYAETDLLCYRAKEPPDLVERQAMAWQPLLDWAALQLDAPLRVVSGVTPVAHPAASLAALRRRITGLDDFQLAALSAVTAAAGSLIIGLALAHGRLAAAEACAASQVDETYQAEHWGEDEQACKTRQALADDIAAAGRFFELLRQA